MGNGGGDFDRTLAAFHDRLRRRSRYAFGERERSSQPHDSEDADRNGEIVMAPNSPTSGREDAGRSGYADSKGMIRAGNVARAHVR